MHEDALGEDLERRHARYPLSTAGRERQTRPDARHSTEKALVVGSSRVAWRVPAS